MTGLTPRAIRRRFLLLRALRWLPTGLMIPVLVLLLTDRGFSLTTIGAAGAAQGVMVLLLELPTGGLADALGRRRVLLGATAVDTAAVALLLVGAWTVGALVAVWGLVGIYRALESGPLDAWYVDAALHADPDADIEAGLGAGGAALGAAIAVGSLASSGLVALDPFPGVDPLAAPLVVYLVLRVVEVVAMWRLMVEVRPPLGRRALADSVRAVPGTVGEALGVVRRSRALKALVAVELAWGFGMVSWENLTPPLLEQVTGSGDRAAALLGPVGAAAWLASALGAAAVPVLTRRLGPARAAAAMRVGQGLTVLGLGLAGGVVGIIAAYVGTYAIHGAANPVHQSLLHREVDGPHRTTVLSVNSMVAMPAASVGAITLGAIADGAGIRPALAAAAAVLAAATPLYLVARSASRSRVVSSTMSPKQRSIA